MTDVRLIDANALNKKIIEKRSKTRNIREANGMTMAQILVLNAPTIDPEALRPVGRWEKPNNRPRTYIRRCSACGGEAYFCGVGCSYDSCPICGVKMERMESE